LGDVEATTKYALLMAKALPQLALELRLLRPTNRTLRLANNVLALEIKRLIRRWAVDAGLVTAR